MRVVFLLAASDMYSCNCINSREGCSSITQKPGTTNFFLNFFPYFVVVQRSWKSQLLCGGKLVLLQMSVYHLLCGSDEAIFGAWHSGHRVCSPLSQQQCTWISRQARHPRWSYSKIGGAFWQHCVGMIRTAYMGKGYSVMSDSACRLWFGKLT